MRPLNIPSNDKVNLFGCYDVVIHQYTAIGGVLECISML